MKFKIITFLFLFTVSCFSQDKDSLISVIKNYKFNDTIQCNRILTFIELEEDAAIWTTYNEKLLALINRKQKNKTSKLESKKYNFFLGQYYNNKGYYFVEKYDYNKALFNYNKAVTIFKEINDNTSLGLVYQNLGTMYDTKGETLKVLPYYNKVLKIRIETNDSLGIANIYSDLGRVYGENGSETKALDYFRKSIKISEKINDEKSVVRTNEFMKNIYVSQKEYEIAIKLIKNNLSYYLKLKNKKQIADSYHNLAFIYNEMNTVKLMDKYNNLSLSIAKKNNFTNLISQAYGIKRDYYLNIKQIDSAFKYSKLENQYSKLSITEPIHTKTILQLSNVYKLKRNFTEAKSIGLDAFQKANELKYPELIMLSARNLKEIYIETNEKVKALNYAQIEIKMKDSLSSINTKNSAIKSLFNYETEKKEAQIKSLSQQKKIANLESQRQKNIALILGIAIISLLIMSYFLFNRYKIKKQNEHLKSQLIQAEKTIQAEKKATESELKALKSQMNPHFIFNALSSIQDQFMFGDKVIANEQMGNFTYLTRQILNVSGKKQILLATEIDILSKYLELEKMRFKTDFEYKITTSETIDEDYHEIPPMLIQPFVENSIKHGLLHKSGNKKVYINFELATNEEYIICTIIDNGIGRQKSAEIKAKNQNHYQSFSTESIKQRLELINENLKLENLITYSDIVENDLVSGTKVVVNIPIG
jgi:two-component system, LytTR family, sensor kinase